MARLVFSDKKQYDDEKKYKIKRAKGWRQVSLFLEPSHKKWWEDPDVVVAIEIYNSSILAIKMPFTPDGDSLDSLQMPVRAKCATVTMMLAERMARSDWSVDDERFFETNTMNVWQTLEFLSNINLKRRYHYEGYNDTENIIRTLTPSWRRDSFAEKNANEETQPTSAKYTNESVSASKNDGNRPTSSETIVRRGNQDEYYSVQKSGRKTFSSVARQVRARSKSAPATREHHAKSGKSNSKRKQAKKRKLLQSPVLDPEYALSPSEYVDLVKCNFKLPRISAALERLMGTNVVRLTDRKYMGDLRSRISEDNRQQLDRRIRARELKEVERERLLIIEGKWDIIPEELADDPIFVVNQAASVEIQKQRAKLKTNRERNAEHLKIQGLKWERERLLHEEEERERIAQQRQRRAEQKQLEERYKEEDLERGMDLLRIDNEDWRECEQKLKEFLETERAKMKERSLRVPTPFVSDKLDILNIVRARQKFRETEQRIRQELEEKFKQNMDQTKQFQAKSAASKVSNILAVENSTIEGPQDIFHRLTVTPSEEILQELAEERERRKYLDDASEDFSESVELTEQPSSISESKRRHAIMLNNDLNDDVARGLLISKEQYNHLQYEDIKILELRQAKNMREMYRLAEEIIIGERIEEVISEGEEGEEPGGMYAAGSEENDEFVTNVGEEERGE